MRKRHYGGWIFVAIIVILVVVGYFVLGNIGYGSNYIVKIKDIFEGNSYAPSSEMAQIQNSLRLTERGNFLFNASRPELLEAAEFNPRCRNGDSEIAILGCYTSNTIYVYNISDERLDGIRELTAAHELLHAVWARMSEDEKASLVEPLTQTFEANQAFLAEEINNYDTDEKQEELYVRAGTEVANLPDTLEQHYAQFFQDQDLVVSYYDSYINVFRTLESEMSALKSEMENAKSEITSTIDEYEKRSSQLNADIISFNSCADVVGCFASEEDFYNRRASLIAEQESLQAMYEQINSLVDAYNAKVVAYNADVLESEKLNTIINSSTAPSAVE